MADDLADGMRSLSQANTKSAAMGGANSVAGKGLAGNNSGFVDFGYEFGGTRGKGGNGSGRTFISQYDIPTDEKGFTKSSLELGKKVHKEYRAGDVDGITKFKEYVLPSGKRVDYIDFENRIVYELKPNNSNQIKKGTKQLAGYLQEIENVFGKGWSTVLDTY